MRLWREGEYWSLAANGTTVRLRDSKGLRYLAVLVTHPEAEFHAVDLVAAGDRAQAIAAPAAAGDVAELEPAVGLGDAGEVLDAAAKAAYRERLEALREELAEAETFNDPERAARAREELDFVAHELSAAVGLGGRDRRASSAAERARVNVTRAIRSVLKKVADEDQLVGRLLEDSVRTGTFCSFCPAPGFDLTMGELDTAAATSTPAVEIPEPAAEHAPEAERPAATGKPSPEALVGRGRELEQLERALTAAAAGRGALYLIAGEPGVGKTHLADALSSRAEELGARVLWGRCWEGGGAPAFWPWMQLIRAYVRDVGEAEAADAIGPPVVRLADQTPEIVTDPAAADGASSQQARFAFFDSVTSGLVALAGSRSLLLVLDDLHAADEPSLRLLEFLARDVRDAPILVVGTYRHGEGGPAAAELLGRLAPRSRLMTLGGLDEDAIAAFVSRHTGNEVSAESVRALREVTEGNPFFVEEVMRLLLAEGVGKLPDQFASDALPLPAGVQEAIRRRLEPLPGEALAALERAALLGKEFALPTLERVSEVPRERLLELLDECVSRALVEEVRGTIGHYRFTHALIREVLHEGLTASARIALHRRIGEELETVYAEDLDPHVAELAHHFVEAAPLGDVDKAIDYAVRAGDSAMRQLAFEEAVRHFEVASHALDLKPGADPAARCDLLLGLGAALARAGRRPRSQETFREAADIAQRIGDAEREARAALGFAGRHWTTGFSDQSVIEMLERAVRAVGDEDSVLKARAVGRLATELYYSPADSDRADGLSAEGLRIARAVGDAAAVAAALDARLTAAWRPANLDERLALAGEIVELAERSGARESELRGRGFLATCLLEACELARADAEIEAVAEIAGELRQPLYLWHMLGLRTLRALDNGRFDDGEQLAHHAYEVGRLADEQTARNYLGAQMAIIAYYRGDWAGLEAPLTDFVERYPRLTAWRCTLAFLYAKLDRPEEARQQLDRAGGDDWSDVPLDGTWLLGVCRGGEAAALAGDREHTRMLYELTLPYAERNVVLGRVASISIGPASRYLAIMAGALGDRASAVAHAEHALEAAERMGLPPWVAHAQHDLAGALVARGSGGDAERAHQLAQAAEATAAALGMTALTSSARR